MPMSASVGAVSLGGSLAEPPNLGRPPPAAPPFRTLGTSIESGDRRRGRLEGAGVAAVQQASGRRSAVAYKDRERAMSSLFGLPPIRVAGSNHDRAWASAWL
jgi:hypothetical protein